MKNKKEDITEILVRLSGEDYCYLTTTGRKSGHPHEIEIWFGIHGNSLYLLSGGGDKSDWVKNLRANPNVTVRIAKHNFMGLARLVENKDEEMMARIILADKYKEREKDGSLSEWGRTALVVEIQLNYP